MTPPTGGTGAAGAGSPPGAVGLRGPAGSGGPFGSVGAGGASGPGGAGGASGASGPGGAGGASGPGGDGAARVRLSDIVSAPPTGWRTGERTLRLLTVAVTAATAALLTGQAWLLALAAGPAVLIALAAPGRARPTRVTAAAEVVPRRLFEGETVTARIAVRHDGEVGLLDPGLIGGPGLTLVGQRVGQDHVELEFTAARWGAWPVGVVDLDVYDSGGLSRRTVRVELGEVEVFPVPTTARLTPVPVRLPQRLGEHTARQHGEGAEVTGVRPHVWGERQRRIHWPSSTRRGAIQLIEFGAERAVDTVMLVDAFGDLIDPVTGASTLDETLRAAAGLTRSYLRTHDRIGVVSVGGRTRWLQAGSGEQHFYRIVQSVLEVRRDLGYRTPDLDRLPPGALPAGALVYAFTPLADQRILDVLRDLADRGNPLVVVEMPFGEPAVDPEDRTAVWAGQLWRADREAIRFALRNRGIPVVTHQPGEALDLAIAPLQRGRIRGRRE